MSLSKYVKYTTLGIAGFVASAELYQHGVSKLRPRIPDEEDINEIIYTQSSGNYKSRLTRNICFVCGPTRFAAEVLINLLFSAKESIYVAMSTFTSNVLAWSLIEAHKNGVDVKCVVDASKENVEKVKMLHKAGIQLKVHEAAPLHLKLCVIDVSLDNTKKATHFLERFDTSVKIPPNGIVVTGSLNWTREGLTRNEENYIVSSNAKMCQNSCKKFLEIWNNSKTLLVFTTY